MFTKICFRGEGRRGQERAGENKVVLAKSELWFVGTHQKLETPSLQKAFLEPALRNPP
jgi:hypothetical protein